VCAVVRRRFPVGASPGERSSRKQPVEHKKPEVSDYHQTKIRAPEVDMAGNFLVSPLAPDHIV
jgi:hypothetical protein